ncbi:MAG: ABC transporter substrate-binding protein [Candidatus Rokubacteria bacterium]|nr:ABC transporter substrate-binding protein [Candidatus Rokubacteria bacterium]
MKTITRATFVALFAMLVVAVGAEGAGPTEQLREGIDKVFGVLSDPALQGADKVAERRARVFAIVDEVFDFGHTARLSLGSYWDRLSPDERAQFVETFRAFINRAYMPNIEGSDGVKLLYTGESLDGDRATVQSKIITTGGSQIPVDFRLVQMGERWRLYDVNIEGTSLVGNYRMQFNKILRTSSYGELVQRLRAKQQ